MKKRRKVYIEQNVFNNICSIFKKEKVEQGGILLSGSDNVIDDFIYDYSAKTTYTSYVPDIEVLNPKIKAKAENGYVLVGNIHSHPRGCKAPSASDIEYAVEIIKAFTLEEFTVIIIQFDGNDKPILYPYIVQRNGKVYAVSYEVTSSSNSANNVTDNGDAFEKISRVIDLESMSKKTAVIIGCGGSAGFVEDLARCGVANFRLIDHDIYHADNICNQYARETNIGMHKVDALKSSILNINPNANVIVLKCKLDNSLSDSDFEEFIGRKIYSRRTDILICGFTDDFFAQARSAALAVKYGIPYLAAQMYLNGDAAEVCFSYPGVTASCPRCMLETRYRAYRKGYKNIVTSLGSTIFSTARVNAICGQIALMLLQYSDKKSRYYRLLDKIADRNFLQIQITPFKANINNGVFEDAFNSEFAFCDSAAWIEQNPERDCPLCGGIGNLQKSIDSIPDTREDLI